MAIAHVRAEWQTKELATTAIADEAIKNLLTKNIIPKFHQLILDMLNQKDELEKYTQAQLKKMVKKELPQNSLQLINETLEFVATQALKQKEQAQKRIANGTLQNLPATQQQLQLLQAQAVNLLELKELVKDAFTLYTTKSILKQLSATLTIGWKSNQLIPAWKQAMQLRHKPPPTTVATRPPRQPKPTTKQPQRAPKTVTKVTLPAPTLKTETTQTRVPMKDRPQIARPIGSHKGKITGTNIDYKKGKCNNWQVWSSCALLSSPRGCKWDHVCSNCNSPLHGASDCPYKK